MARLWGQAAAGDFEFASLGTSIDLVTPLPWRLAGAARFTFGQAFGELPAQALWYLGGTKTVRGYPANSASGEAAYVVNFEVVTDLPLIRLVLFSDVGSAAQTGHVLTAEPLVSVGSGLSLFDGIVRLDVARGLTRNGVWRIHFATSGLF